MKLTAFYLYINPAVFEQGYMLILRITSTVVSIPTAWTPTVKNKRYVDSYRQDVGRPVSKKRDFSQ